MDIFIAVVLKDNQSSVVHVRWSFSRKSLCCTLLEVQTRPITDWDKYTLLSLALSKGKKGKPDLDGLKTMEASRYMDI